MNVGDADVHQACFLGALQAVAAQKGKKDLVKNAVVSTEVHIGKPNGLEGFGLEVDIKVGGVSDDELLKLAHEVCRKSADMLFRGIVSTSMPDVDFVLSSSCALIVVHLPTALSSMSRRPKAECPADVQYRICLIVSTNL